MKEKINSLKVGLELEYVVKLSLNDLEKLIEEINNTYGGRLILKREIELDSIKKVSFYNNEFFEEKRGLEISYGPFLYVEKNKVFKTLDDVIKTIEKKVNLELDGLKYFYSNTACHIHLDIKKLKEINEDLPSFLAYFFLNERNKVLINLVSKRRSYYKQMNKFLKNNCKNIVLIDKFKLSLYLDYFTLKSNVFSHGIYGTLEIRSFRSSKNINDVKNYLDFVINLVEYFIDTYNGDIEKIGDWKKYLLWKIKKNSKISKVFNLNTSLYNFFDILKI